MTSSENNDSTQKPAYYRYEMEAEYIATEDELSSLHDYFEAALKGEESKTALRNLWRQNMEIIVSRRIK